MKYIQKYMITSNMCDKNRVIKASGILDLFQSVAGIHANRLGIGMQDIYPKGYAWVLMRIEYKVWQEIPMETEVMVETWPKTAGKIDFDRYYLIKDLNGNLMVEGISKWVILDLKTRRISRTDAFKYPYACLKDEVLLPMNKINADDIVFNEKRKYQIRESDIDMVGHLNNTKYADLCYDIFPKNYQSFCINYLHEIGLNEEILIEKGCKDNLTYVKVQDKFIAVMEAF